MVDRLTGGGRIPPLTRLGWFTTMIELCTLESGHCQSISTLSSVGRTDPREGKRWTNIYLTESQIRRNQIWRLGQETGNGFLRLFLQPMDEWNIIVYCCPSTFSLTPLPPSQTKCTVYIDSVAMGVGGVALCCRPYSAGDYTLFLTRFKTYKIAPPPQTKMTNKDDI